jgi:hypothetical protein
MIGQLFLKNSTGCFIRRHAPNRSAHLVICYWGFLIREICWCDSQSCNVNLVLPVLRSAKKLLEIAPDSLLLSLLISVDIILKFDPVDEALASAGGGLRVEET